MNYNARMTNSTPHAVFITPSGKMALNQIHRWGSSFVGKTLFLSLPVHIIAYPSYGQLRKRFIGFAESYFKLALQLFGSPSCVGVVVLNWNFSGFQGLSRKTPSTYTGLHLCRTRFNATDCPFKSTCGS